MVTRVPSSWIAARWLVAEYFTLVSSKRCPSRFTNIIILFRAAYGGCALVSPFFCPATGVAGELWRTSLEPYNALVLPATSQPKVAKNTKTDGSLSCKRQKNVSWLSETKHSVDHSSPLFRQLWANNIWNISCLLCSKTQLLNVLYHQTLLLLMQSRFFTTFIQAFWFLSF